jgi:hypothetical protein
MDNIEGRDRDPPIPAGYRQISVEQSDGVTTHCSSVLSGSVTPLDELRTKSPLRTRSGRSIRSLMSFSGIAPSSLVRRKSTWNVLRLYNSKYLFQNSLRHALASELYKKWSKPGRPRSVYTIPSGFLSLASHQLDG